MQHRVVGHGDGNADVHVSKLGQAGPGAGRGVQRQDGDRRQTGYLCEDHDDVLMSRVDLPDRREGRQGISGGK